MTLQTEILKLTKKDRDQALSFFTQHFIAYNKIEKACMECQNI